jgi:hypothetical protein
MSSKFPRQMVSPREIPPHVRHLPLAATVIEDDGTIETFRGKARCKSLYLTSQLSVFLAPVIYRVVKITCSCSEAVL